MVADAEAVSACVEVGTYAETVGANHRPDNCFRVRVGGDATAKNPKLSNYLDGYRVEVAAADSEVAWGKVEWDPDPFEDLECESMTFVAADQIDVCAMFEEEVDQAVAAGWGVSNPQTGARDFVLLWPAERESAGNADSTNGSVLHSWAARVTDAKPDRFKTLWFDHDLDGKIRDDAAPLFELGPDVLGGTERFTVAAMNDLYDDNSVPEETGAATNTENIWQYLTDEDGDPVYGDFGKVDLYSRTTAGADDEPSDTLCKAEDGDGCGDDQGPEPDGMADNYQGRAAEKCDPDDGGEDACDAEWSRDFEVLFADGLFGCTTTRPVTISCVWDAQGQLDSNPRTLRILISSVSRVPTE